MSKHGLKWVQNCDQASRIHQNESYSHFRTFGTPPVIKNPPENAKSPTSTGSSGRSRVRPLTDYSTVNIESKLERVKICDEVPALAMELQDPLPGRATESMPYK